MIPRIATYQAADGVTSRYREWRPERYNAMGFGEAYRAILQTPLAHLDPYTLVGVDGGNRMTVPLAGVGPR